jgi:hypothetical protein
MVPGPGLFGRFMPAVNGSASFDLNFASNSYLRNGTSLGADPFTAGLLTLTRGSAAWAHDTAGKWTRFAANTPRITSAGLTLESTAATNLVGYSDCSGTVVGTPGTPPAGWSVSAQSGISYAVTDYTPADSTYGLPRVRIRFYGTATANAYQYVYFGPSVPISAGNTYCMSIFVKVAAGSIPATTGLGFLNAAQLLLQAASNASGSVTGVSAPTSLGWMIPYNSTTLKRLNFSDTMPAGATFAQPCLQLSVMNGTTIDVSFDFLCPQMELGNLPTSPIVTSGGVAVTRAGDICTANAALLDTLTDGPVTAAFTESARLHVINGLPARTLLTLNGVAALGVDKTGALVSATAGLTGMRTVPANWMQVRTLVKTWNTTSAQVASSAAAEVLSGGATPGPTFSAGLADGLIARLQVSPGYTVNLQSYQHVSASVVHYGTTGGGVISTYESARSGANTVLIGGWRDCSLGGMMSNGLGQTDITTAVVPASGATPTNTRTVYNGLGREVIKRINWYQGRYDANFSFDTRFAEFVFQEMMQEYGATVSTYYSKGVGTVTKSGAKIASFTTVDGKAVTVGYGAADHSYEADLAVAAGVTHTYGREAKNSTTDSLNGYVGVQSSEVSSQSSSEGSHQFCIPDAFTYVNINGIALAGSTTLPLASQMISGAFLSGTGLPSSGVIATNPTQSGSVWNVTLSAATTADLINVMLSPAAAAASGATTLTFSGVPGSYVFPAGTVVSGSGIQSGTTVTICLYSGSTATVTLSKSLSGALTTNSNVLFGNASVLTIQVVNVDPYVTKGVSTSGLLPTVQSLASQPSIGAADAKIQAYTFRFPLIGPSSNAPYRVVPFPSTRPRNYSIGRYELLLRYFDALSAAGFTYNAGATDSTQTTWTFASLMICNPLPSGTYDINNRGGFSTDWIGGSWMDFNGNVRPYPTSSYNVREQIWEDHQDYVAGLFYTLAYGRTNEGDTRVPSALETDARSWGFDAWACPSAPHPNDASDPWYKYFPRQLYIREANRIQGQLVWHYNDLSATDGTTPRGTPVGCGSYPADSHHVQRIADTTWTGKLNGDAASVRVWNEGNFVTSGTGGTDKIYPTPWEVLTPTASDCTNLLVTFGVSATHMAFAAFRMEMVACSNGHVAGAALAQLASGGSSDGTIQNLNLTTLKSTLTSEGQIIPTVN